MNQNVSLRDAGYLGAIAERAEEYRQADQGVDHDN